MRQLRLIPAAACLAAACSAQTSYRLTDLGSLKPDGDTWAFAVNDSGLVAGFSLYDLDDRLMTGVLMGPGPVLDLTRFQGGDWAWAWAINNSGQIAGTSHRLGFGDFAFRFDGGGLILLDQLKGGTEAFGINSAGVVVGAANPGPPHPNTRLAVRWNGTKITKLASLGGLNSIARAINDLGDIVGYAEVPKGPMHACLWHGDQAADLGTLGGRGSDAYDIDEAGRIVGWAHDASGVERACLWENGVASDLGTLGTASRALAINDAGWIVGTSWVVGQGRRAFVRTDTGELLNLNLRVRQASGWVLQHATDINSTGVIVGYGRANGRTGAFLLTPICDADLNADGVLDLLDFLAFTNLFNAGDLQADFDGSGTLDIFDFLAFTNTFNARC